MHEFSVQRARYGPVAIVVLAVAPLLCALAACSAPQGAGMLDSESDDSTLTSKEIPGKSAALKNRDAAEKPSGEANSPQNFSTGPAETPISSDRVTAVTDAVHREAATVGLGVIHSIRVLSEGPESSLALTQVTRNGVRQLLAVTVLKVKKAWTISNINTLPNAQDLQ